MQLLITPLAAYDLEEIGDYIAQDNPVRAGSFVAELRAHCEKICLTPPLLGHLRQPQHSPDRSTELAINAMRKRQHRPRICVDHGLKRSAPQT